MTTGEKIKQKRKERGWTQEYLGEVVHVSDKTVSSWETGRSTPSEELLRLLAGTFNISLKELETDSMDAGANNKTVTDITVVNGDCALDYLMWHQQKTRKTLKVMMACLVLMIIGLLVLGMTSFGFHPLGALIMYLVLEITAWLLAKKFSQKAAKEHFDPIESKEFRLDADAQRISLEKKAEYQEQVRSNAMLAGFGIISLTIWFVDTLFDSGLNVSMGAIIVYMIGFTVIMAMCVPIRQHWLAIRKLLHETTPQIPTPFNKSFWRKQ